MSLYNWLKLRHAKILPLPVKKYILLKDPRLEGQYSIAYDKKGVELDLAWWHASKSNHIVPITSNYYPSLLRELVNPPLLLYVQGNKEILLTKFLAVAAQNASNPQVRANFTHLVKPFLTSSTYSMLCAPHLGLELNIVNLSQSLLNKIVLVLGCGLQHYYPQNFYYVRALIMQHGALISTEPINVLPDNKANKRANELIAGLTSKLLVLESSLRCNAYALAKLCLDNNREVCAVPGPINVNSFFGSNRLLQDGAGLILQASDLP